MELEVRGEGERRGGERGGGEGGGGSRGRRKRLNMSFIVLAQYAHMEY